MKISVAIATYNGARHLSDQLESIAYQTRLPDEVVISDDVSSDETVAIARTFAERSLFPIRIHQNPKNLGYTKNFEAAFHRCLHEIIVISDQDDVWFSNKLETIGKHFAANPNALLFINDCVITDSTLTPTRKTKLSQIRRLQLNDSQFVSGCCSAFLKDLLSVASPFPDHVIEYDEWLHLLANTLQARHCLDTPLQFYRRHGHNTSGWIASNSQTAWLSILKAAISNADPRQRCRTRISSLRIASSRLQQITEEAEPRLNDGWPIEKARTEIEQQINSISERLSLLSMPRHHRLWPALQMFWSNRYSHFSGSLSLFKDLIAR